VSQVIVTQDVLTPERERARQEEHKIDKDSEYRKWQLGDPTKNLPLVRAILAPIVLPLIAFWTLLSIVVGGALFLVMAIMRIGSLIFRGSTKP
jgi:hypothetical protein